MNEYEFTAVRVFQLMNLAAEAIESSPAVSGHVMGELLSLIEKLKTEEGARLLEAESRYPMPSPA